ncbi:TraR/DksA C4-type zinc finger protein [Paraburkholderia fungorum]|uniref:TraR/DksA C4-type zinc finger protein n=1 Tax=Paraburkholderia fungorum TaxID=134537 RepID=UPI00402B7EC3
MPDASDLATTREEELREDALQAMRRARDAASSQPGAPACDRCGEPIPQARREAVPGCRHCVTCQRKLEMKR